MAKRHPYRKKWGQNFLRDPNSITKIINLIGPQKKDVILEIGPGDGALTGAMHHKAAHVHAVEIDPLLVEYLSKKKYENVTIHESDILDWDLSILNEDFKVVGNLPYYISTPILFKFLEKMNWQQMIFMFQKELADRIISKEGSRAYGRISVMSQVYCDVRIEFNVSRNVFHPKPDVDSSVLSFYPKEANLPDPNMFSGFIKQAFAQRRKKLKNNLQDAYEKGLIDNFSDLRPEAISPREYLEIYQMIYFG
tara:strand:- start:198 stop:950 length:753 start_codon:yes stop_codon:yes gene_type:complete